MSLVYTPPSDQEHSEHAYDAGPEEDSSAIPPRQSAIPYKLFNKQYKSFYTDEHPEVPKIRRASLKQTKVGVLPMADPQAQPKGHKTVLHTPVSEKRSPKARRPFNNPVETNIHEQSEIAPYPRQTRKKVQHTMPPLTGLESATEIRTWQNETGTHKRSSFKQNQKIELPADEREIEDNHANETAERARISRHSRTGRHITQRPKSLHTHTMPRRQPSPGTRPPTEYPRYRSPLFQRKRTWLLLGLVSMLLLIIIPLIFHSGSAPTPMQKVGQGQTTPVLPPTASNPHQLVITPPQTDHPAPPLFATSAYVLDTDHETTLFAQNPFVHLPMLSTTKLMTATLAVEKGNLDQQVTISPLMQQEINQLSADSALFGIQQGQTYTLRDLLYGLLYSSGNDAALAIANVVGGNVSNFVAAMNQKAQSLGMLDTHFVNPHGLLDNGQYSCAHDLAILGQYSLNIPTIQHMSSAKTYQIAAGGNHPARILLNENQFLWWFPGTTGGKTGYDGVSDFVQVMSVTRNHHHLIGVVMHTNNWWTDMRDLMDYGSTDYTWASPRDVEVSGHPVVYDNLWHYFTSDTTHVTIAMGTQGRYYIYTGYTVSGSILAYFDQQGGLAKFGFPIKMPISSGTTLITQQFQQSTIQCDTSNQQCHLL